MYGANSRQIGGLGLVFSRTVVAWTAPHEMHMRLVLLPTSDGNATLRVSRSVSGQLQCFSGAEMSPRTAAKIAGRVRRRSFALQARRDCGSRQHAACLHT